MERKTFNVTFFLRRARTSKKGLAPILARITTNGISKEIYIQCSVDPQKWDQAKERAIGRDSYSQQVNTYLDEYRTRILQIRQDLEKKHVTRQYAKFSSKGIKREMEKSSRNLESIR